MDKEEIKASLRKHGCSFMTIATVLGKHHLSIARVASRTTTSKPIATAIAKAVDRPIEKVFPDKPEYHPGYDPKKVARDHLSYWAAKLAS